MKLLNKLEKKFGKYAVKNLMYYIIMLYALGFVIMLVKPEIYSMFLSLNAPAILKGQIWRIFTYIIYPPTGSLITILISLYFYYVVGSMLERQWGTFRFNLYFFHNYIFSICQSIGVNPFSFKNAFVLLKC